MPDDNLKVYSDDEVRAKIDRARPGRMVSRRGLAAAEVNTDGWPTTPK